MMKYYNDKISMQKGDIIKMTGPDIIIMYFYNGLCLIDATQQPADAGVAVNVGDNDAVQIGIILN